MLLLKELCVKSQVIRVFFREKEELEELTANQYLKACRKKKETKSYTFVPFKKKKKKNEKRGPQIARPKR